MSFRHQTSDAVALDLGGGITYGALQTRFGDVRYTAYRFHVDLVVAATRDLDVIPFVSGQSVEQVTLWFGGLTIRVR
jgi:hypothetical protein